MNEGQSEPHALYDLSMALDATAQPRVLIVDDEQPVLRAYSRALRNSGFVVETAGDGEAALGHIARSAFDVVLSDLMMPRMPGIEFLRAVRKRDPDLPVVLMTACPSTESAMRALEYGAMRYLLKPIDLVDLTTALRDGVRLRKAALAKRKAEQAFADDRAAPSELGALDAAFERALTSLSMVYQPLVRWSTREIFGFEALVRTREPALPHPGALFDAAERLDRTSDIGRAIRRRIPLPIAEAPSSAQIFVNLHPKDLVDEELYARRGPLAKHAARVVLEITERASLHDIPDLHARVSELRKLGYKIAIDDIGAGYAGLTSFAMLEPEVVKVDMALVRDIDKSSMKKKLVHSIVSLCRDLNIQLIAEGVESVQERDTLVDLGCDLFQGYLFARPGPAFPTVSL
jgi:EAL domain-containing protein (putative c-di-GMP-specific phosphodiesterase class I)